MLPTYAPLFVPALFQTIKDADPTMRASALSTLATACQLLRYSVGAFMQELLSALTAVLSHDQEAEVYSCWEILFSRHWLFYEHFTAVQVRRGAVHLLKLLLRGCGPALLRESATELAVIMRLLRRIEDVDPDDVTQYVVCALAFALCPDSPADTTRGSRWQS
jgi:hypothetical protein